jgi:Uma2 family endonuclease
VAVVSPLLFESFRPLRRGEFDRLVELGTFDDERVELLSGVLVQMSPQGAEHSSVVSELATLLIVALGSRAKVRTHSPLALSEESEPEPDIAVVLPADYTRELPTTALLVIEVADSSLRKDRQLKAALYAAAGVAEYWIVNLAERVVEVQRAPKDRGYENVTRHDPDQNLRVAAFADVELAVSQFLRSR